MEISTRQVVVHDVVLTTEEMRWLGTMASKCLHDHNPATISIKYREFLEQLMEYARPYTGMINDSTDS